jgi:hypothetical protein
MVVNGLPQAVQCSGMQNRLLVLDDFLGNLAAECCSVWLVRVHPESPDETLPVSNSETRNFSSWQGNRGVVRRRTSVRRTNNADD